ncbi:MAG: hypothetical protein PXX77_06820, partial [Gallionella sp.]|nr:hypothetical protein [Gallionella sp.]
MSAGLLSLFAFFHSVNAEPLRIAIVYGESGSAYQEFIKAFQGNVSMQHKVRAHREGDQIGDDVDLVIAVGMKAANLQATLDRPVLNVFVPRNGFEKLQRAPSPTFSAIFMDQPVQRQLALIASALPESTTVGIMYSTPPAELDSLRKFTAAISLDLNEHLVDQQHPLAGALSDLLRE